MSLTNRSFHTLSRSTPRTLLSFLYQTPTIQQHRFSLAQRRNASFRSRHEDEDIPFEGGIPEELSSGPPRKTTLTASEREVFEKLRKTVAADANTASESQDTVDRDSEFDIDEPDNDVAASLDSVFDAVLAGRNLSTLTRAAHRGKAFKKTDLYKKTENLTTLAASILKEEVNWSRKQSKEKAEEQAQRIREARDKERERVTGLLDNAKTDTEVWEILQHEVFDIIGKLNLDGSGLRSTAKGKKAKAPEPTPNETTTNTTPETKPASLAPALEPLKPHPGILLPNFPQHILYAIRLLRNDFPTSSLPLSIIPTLKSLGRASYMLCATTPLYNALLRTAWIQYGSYEALNELLTDMDNGGIEFDFVTMTILEEVLAEAEQAKRGAFGTLSREVWSTERYEEATKKLAEWKDVVVRYLKRSAIIRATEGNIIRKTNKRGGREQENVVWPGMNV